MRIFVIVIELVILIGAAIWLVTQPGSVALHWGEYEMETNLSVGFLALTVVFVIWALLFKTWRFIVLLPARMYAYSQKLRPEKGMRALTQSLISTALEECDQAKTDAYRFERFMGDNAVHKALLAYNEMHEGKLKEARLICEGMKNESDAKTLSWILEVRIALREGNDVMALTSLQNLYQLHDKSPWVSRELIKCSLRLKMWETCLEVMKKAERNGILDSAKIKKIRACIFYKQAESETIGLDQKENLLEGAHRLAPDLVKVTVKYAKILRLLDKAKRAKKAIEHTWSLHPHVDLMEEFVAMEHETDPKAIMSAAAKLSSYNEHAPESYLAMAKFALKHGEWARARAALHDYQEKHEITQEACYLMARLELSQHADHARYGEWMERALHMTAKQDDESSFEADLL